MTAEAPRAEPAAWQVTALVALAYAVTGWFALLLAVPPGYASPLYPSAGIALAAVLVYGRPAVAGAALGAFLVNFTLGASRGVVDLSAVALPAAIGLGAGLQAALGATLVRRFVAQPLTLAEPRDILRFGVLGAALACVVSASLATGALRLAGTVLPGQMLTTVWTWWVGDTLGVLIGAPLVLTLIGLPRADWATRRRTVGLPLLLASGLLAGAAVAVGRWDEDRLRATFNRDAEALASAVEGRLAAPVHALQALHSTYLVRGGLDGPSLRAAAQWWLQQPLALQAMGYSVYVPRAEVAAFEAQARSDGLPGYRVFDRAPAATTRDDAGVVAIRLIEPPSGNLGALGVNALSIPAARSAIQQAWRSGEAVATAGFRLTQSTVDETGVVLYQPLYRGVPATEAERAVAFQGVVFVTLRAERTLGIVLRPDTAYLGWCLVDRDPATPRPRLAGPAGCEQGAADGFETRRALHYAGRDWELRIWAAPRQMPGLQQANAWLFAVVGLLAAAVLGALLLMVTGRTRRIEAAVDERTAELEREMAEHQAADLALRDSEARLRSIFDHVPIGVVFLDPMGHLIEANPRFCEMLGRSAQALRGMTVVDISHPDEAGDNRRQLADLLSGRSAVIERQMRLLRADGASFWARIVVTLLRDGQGRALRLAGVVEDITEHLRLEESERARDRAEAASRLKNEFVSRMSHELRTPLNAMLGFAQLLAMDRELNLAPHQREWVGQIQRAGWHLLEMINDTLDLASIESGKVQLVLRPLDLQGLLGHCVAMLAGVAAARGVSITLDLEADARGVVADETRLTQVLTNLLSNAVKYNREGGKVRVVARRAAGGRVAVAVHDTGLGMTPEQQAALFQPYNRLGREHSGIQGTGIGLVISRGLAELMSGTLDADSQAGQGSVFTLSLPAAGAEVAGLAAGAAELQVAVPPYRQRHLHYIEDNETNIEVMRGILAQRPQIVLGVSMLGLDGLAAVRRQRPDLILLDMHLPDINGMELLRHLKQDPATGDIPVVVVSADATRARIEEALTLGALHYVTKPVDVARLLAIVDEVAEAQDSRWG